jgi:hypothetical protein
MISAGCILWTRTTSNIIKNRSNSRHRGTASSGRERADLQIAHETIQNRMMRLIKIDTSKQLADNFTKPLAYAQFIGCIRGILGKPDAMRQTKFTNEWGAPPDLFVLPEGGSGSPHTDIKISTRLPIPEGCLHMDSSCIGNGQSGVCTDSPGK